MKESNLVQKIKASCNEVCSILKSMSHPQRLLVLVHLYQGEKTVTELVELCSISQSQMSQFLIRMKLDGLIKSEKKGKFQYYSVADKRLSHLLKTIQKEYCKSEN